MCLHHKSYILYLLTALAVYPAPAAEESAVQRVVWDKQPIALQLHIGDERRIQFRAPVSVGVPGVLQELLRIQTVNGTVYLLAHRAFPKTRVLVRELDGGQTYLLDITAVDGKQAMPPMLVHLPDNAGSSASSVKVSGPPGYVELTRFAAQQLYAPERLIAAMPGVQRVPVQEGKVSLLPGRSVEASPLIAWRAGELYVTAVKLKNCSKRFQLLDPRTLRGNWLSATFQHARLSPADTNADTTVVYLVSAQAFAASL